MGSWWGHFCNCNRDSNAFSRLTILGNPGLPRMEVDMPSLGPIYMLWKYKVNSGRDGNCVYLSVYDMKNISCLFERPFELQKNGIFLVKISFFVSEILTFLYYAN